MKNAKRLFVALLALAFCVTAIACGGEDTEAIAEDYCHFTEEICEGEVDDCVNMFAESLDAMEEAGADDCVEAHGDHWACAAELDECGDIEDECGDTQDALDDAC